MIKKLLSLFLVGLILVVRETQHRSVHHPFVPPLTHVAELSLPRLGIPPPPPRLLLPRIEQISDSSCEQCNLIRSNIQQEALRGKALRLQIQDELITILNILPIDISENAIKNRMLHSERIGELQLWKTLSLQD